MDYAVARQYGRQPDPVPNKVTDERLIEAIRSLPRERFVPESLRARAYLDDDVELAPGRYLMEPMVTARLIQTAEVKATDMALVVGAASGYAAALLARLVNTVVALESDKALAKHAGLAFAELGIDNALVFDGPLPAGCPKHAPYDVIYLDGAVEEVPQSLADQLGEGGRMVGVLVEGGIGRAMLWLKSRGAISRRVLFDANVAPLPGFKVPARFVL